MYPWPSSTALVAAFQRDENGQGLAEYALILALIAIVAIIALIFLGNQVSGILSTVELRSNGVWHRALRARGSKSFGTSDWLTSVGIAH